MKIPNMANSKLGQTAVIEIRAAMSGLTQTASKQTAERLASQHLVGVQRIYELTEDLRPKRKTRADKGKRSFQLVESTDVWIAAQLVISDKLDPDQALATCKVRGLKNLPTLEYFQKMLRENGLNKKQRQSSKRPYREWEAENPGEIYQIDVTALKVRWQDEKTRRILRIEGIDKNHPNLDDGKIRVWQIMAVDDHSRRRFLRYIVTTHVTSRDMVEFVCELFSVWGVCQTMYTDNGAEFKGYFIRAEKLIHKILENDGGYVHERHVPGNSQASGKVEVAHKWAEKMDKYVGLAINEGQDVTFENLNAFADDACLYYNEVRIFRKFGQTPIARWHSKRIVVRKLPREIIESALLAKDYNVMLQDAMVVTCDKVNYRIPSEEPYFSYRGHKITVVIPSEIDLILVKLPSDIEFRELPKIIATADKAGEFKSHAETNAQNLTKRLKATRKEEIKEIKAKNKLTGEIAPIPHFNVPTQMPKTNVTNFPHHERVITPDEIAAVTPIAVSLYIKEISYWEAVVKFENKFADTLKCQAFLEDFYGDLSKIINETEVETAVKNREFTERRGLKAVG
jgi:hypothetical protein